MLRDRRIKRAVTHAIRARLNRRAHEPKGITSGVREIGRDRVRPTKDAWSAVRMLNAIVAAMANVVRVFDHFASRLGAFRPEAP